MTRAKLLVTICQIEWSRSLEYAGWPIGMPLVRSLRVGLWEIRIRLVNRIARVVFVVFEGNIVLLHGFIKKQQETPKADLQLAVKRLKSLQKD